MFLAVTPVHAERHPQETDQNNVELISRYLRFADTPNQFVENFMKSIQNRNGAVARLFLAPNIRGQIPPRVIGVSTELREMGGSIFNTRSCKIRRNKR